MVHKLEKSDLKDFTLDIFSFCKAKTLLVFLIGLMHFVYILETGTFPLAYLQVHISSPELPHQNPSNLILIIDFVMETLRKISQ